MRDKKNIRSLLLFVTSLIFSQSASSGGDLHFHNLTHWSNAREKLVCEGESFKLALRITMKSWRITWENSLLLAWTLSSVQPCCCQRLLVESLAPSSLQSSPMCPGTPWTSPLESLPSPSGPKRTLRPWPPTQRTTWPTRWSTPIARMLKGSHWLCKWLPGHTRTSRCWSYCGNWRLEHWWESEYEALSF